MTNPSTTAMNFMMRHQHQLARYTNQEVAKMSNLMDAVERRIIQQLSTVITDPNAQRLQALLSRVREINFEAHLALEEGLRQDLTDFAAHEAGFTADVLNKAGADVSLEFTLPAVNQIASAALDTPFEGHLLKDWVRKLEADSYFRLSGEIRAGFVEGKSVSQIVSSIQTDGGLTARPGVMVAARRQVEAVVRTAVNHVATQAREEVFRENSDVIEGVRWVSVLDDRTSEICMALSGEVFPIDEGPRPPAHFNCRSTTVPVIMGYKEPPVKTYESWLKQQPASTQDEILGNTKGMAFRAGDLSLKDLVNQDLQVQTLQELQLSDRQMLSR